MMMAAKIGPDTLDLARFLRGRAQADAPLAPLTWFRVGGSADLLVRPADADDLATFLAAIPAELPVTIIGAASNLIVRDGGVPGIVIKLGRGFGRITRNGDALIAGAAIGWELDRMAVVDRNVLRLAVAELLECPDVPTAVILNEAVELASAYSTDDSGRFVNGVLATLAEQLRG